MDNLSVLHFKVKFVLHVLKHVWCTDNKNQQNGTFALAAKFSLFMTVIKIIQYLNREWNSGYIHKCLTVMEK